MRISDWSSDVCSSDLPKHYAATVTTDELARDARGRWEHSMDALRQTMLVQAQVVQNVEVDSGELARLVTQSQAAVGNLQALQATNQLIALSTKQQLQTQEMVARSEEHTSELQSLMRISYAVFCLKNKNQKDLNTTHPTQL